MKRVIGALLVSIGLVGTALQPAHGDPSFTRAGNTSAGRAVFESGPARLDVLTDDVWHLEGQDILPFDYEQGVAFAGQGMGSGLTGSLVFTSRGAVIKTTLGCPDPEDDAVPCYDEEVRRDFGISGDEFQLGFDHIGDVDVGREGDAAGFVFAPLETQSRGGSCPRQNRAYKAYRVSDLSTAGRLIETGICHRNHSWVTVDPTGRWLLAADPGTGSAGAFSQTIRVHEIVHDPDAAGTDHEITITPTDPDPEKRLDIVVSSEEPLPNYAGCAFRTSTELYCSDWLDTNDLDVGTRIYRIDLTAPVGGTGVTATGRQIFFLELEPKYTGADIDGDGDREPVVPFGNETEGITFYRRSKQGPPEMHVLLRGETLGWFYYVHLAPGPSG